MNALCRVTMLLAFAALAACTSGSDVEPGQTTDPGTTTVAPAALWAQNNCQLCHGANGEGGSGPALNSPATCDSCDSKTALVAAITDTMPTLAPSVCVGECADMLADHIMAFPPPGTTPAPPPPPPPGGTPPPPPPGDPAVALGKVDYDAQCAVCHGATGQGVGSFPALDNLVSCPTCVDAATLTAETAATMPVGNVNLCIGDCASNTSAYILATFFNSAAAANSAGNGLKTVDANMAQTVAGNLLSPARLASKLNSTLGVEWSSVMASYRLTHAALGAPELDLPAMTDGIMYGVTANVTGEACDIVTADFDRAPEQRRLFTHVESENSADDLAIRETLKHMFDVLQERTVEISDPEIENALAQLSAATDNACGDQSLSAWAQVLTDIVSSYDFIYE